MTEQDRKEIKSIFKQINTLMKPSGDHATSDNFPGILYEEKIREQQKLLQQLSLWFKTSEDRRRVMEKRNKNLLTENQELRNALSMEREKMENIHQKVKDFQGNHDKMIKLKEEQMLKESRKLVPLVDKETSVTDLALSDDKVTQTVVLECTCCKSSTGELEKKMPSMNLTISELSELEEDMKELKELLYHRENRWSKLAEREMEQRQKLTNMDTELSFLRQVAERRKNDLDSRVKDLKTVSYELKRTQKEVVILRKHISKMENKDRCEQYCKMWLDDGQQFV